jgi:hypothetical protein
MYHSRGLVHKRALCTVAGAGLGTWPPLQEYIYIGSGSSYAKYKYILIFLKSADRCALLQCSLVAANIL